MTDMTSAVQAGALAGVAPTYTQCTATDKFLAVSGGRYMLHYKNGATPTSTLKITDQTSVAPASASGAGAGWADVQVSAALAGAAERVVWIDNSTRFRDSSGFINMAHTTPTTLTVAIFGPF